MLRQFVWVGRNGFECRNPLQPLDHFVWHWGWLSQSMDWHKCFLYCCNIYNFCSWFFWAERTVRTWPHVMTLHMSKFCNICIALEQKVPEKAWPLFFLELLKILKKTVAHTEGFPMVIQPWFQTAVWQWPDILLSDFFLKTSQWQSSSGKALIFYKTIRLPLILTLAHYCCLSPCLQSQDISSALS